MRKNMAEKADYLQIGGSNINSKNKGLCLGTGILTTGRRGWGGGWRVTNIFVIYQGGRDFLSSGIRGGVVCFCPSRENVTALPQ